VFIGHNVPFINDKNPRAANVHSELQTEDHWDCVETKVEAGTSIGFSVTILCGLNIGENAIIIVGSVVLVDVPDNTIYAGNLAK
jgi:acetyltransferase-like isoleucine patch superfamily enzyme